MKPAKKLFYRSEEKEKNFSPSFLKHQMDRFWNEVLKTASDCSNDPARALRSAVPGTGRYSVVSEQGDVPTRLSIVCIIVIGSIVIGI